MPSQLPNEIHARFQAAFSSGNLEALVALYESDAVLGSTAGQIVKGHAAIREAYRGYLAAKPTITIETVAVFENGGLALLHGNWKLKGTGPDGAEVARQGCSSEVVRRQPDGNWLFAIDNPFTPEERVL